MTCTTVILPTVHHGIALYKCHIFIVGPRDCVEKKGGRCITVREREGSEPSVRLYAVGGAYTAVAH